MNQTMTKQVLRKGNLLRKGKTSFKLPVNIKKKEHKSRYQMSIEVNQSMVIK